MSFKSVLYTFTIIIATIILMRNADAVDFWLFGDAKISKIAIVGCAFIIGYIFGLLSFRSKKKPKETSPEDPEPQKETTKHYLSDNDRDYIS